MKQTLTIFTCSIYPDVTRIWFYCLKKILKDETIPVVIYDSSGLLKPELFPGATLIRFPNLQHGKKIDHFVANHLKTDLFLLCDDDAFLVSGEPLAFGLNWIQQEPKHAIVSYKPRLWWSIKIDEREYPTMGSYALLIKALPIRENLLSFEVQKTDRTDIRKGSGYYDTADYINEYLLKQGYVIELAPEELRSQVPTFFGTSSAMMTFYGARWFHRRRKRKKDSDIEDLILKEKGFLQRALSVAFVTRIHKILFTEPMVYHDFLSLEEIETVVRKSGNSEYETVYNDTVKDFERIENQILNI